MLSKILAFFACLILCASAAAADYAPLQPAHAGNWYDPSQSGVGFDILPYSVPHSADGAFVTFYERGHGAIAPAWSASQPEWHGPGPVTAPLYISTDEGPKVVGSLTISTDGKSCGSLSADVAVDGQAAQHFDLVPIIQPLAAQCHTCGGFSPLPPGCH